MEILDSSSEIGPT